MLRLKPHHGVILVVVCVLTVMASITIYSLLLLNRETVMRVRMAELELRIRELDTLYRQHIEVDENRHKITQERLAALEERRTKGGK